MKTTLEYYLLLLLFLSHLVLLSVQEYSRNCPRFACGMFSELQFPFSNTNNPLCGLFVMNCTGPVPQVQFHEKGKWYQVFPFNDLEQTIVIRDQDVERHLESNKCDLLNNFTEHVSPFLEINVTYFHPFFKCKRDLRPTSSSFFKSFQNYSCKDYDLFFNASGTLPTLPESLSGHCLVIHSSRLLRFVTVGSNNQTLLNGTDFGIKWQVHPLCMRCHQKGGRCTGSSDKTLQCADLKDANVGLKVAIVPRVGQKVAIGSIAGVGCVILTVLIFALWNCRHSSSTLKILWEGQNKTQMLVEDFLKSHGSLVHKRYNYYDLKKMTSSFKDKIGQGGFGEVYKGKLPDGRLVAVKLLNDDKGTGGQDFINEVASISRTSHVNIVSLLGFCFDGSKRALIYEFMANGSLEKYIYNPSLEDQPHLGWETLYQIAIGVARGLVYLHRGCNTRILHFDIKPHNILLDIDFIPKISDFGLAKLCPRKESIISMLDARGTAGYIAPEVFSRQFGGVSHKSDVYSYGMMVLEVIGKRKNVDVRANHTSEIYFPEWIYKRLEIGEDLGLNGTISAEEKDTARKMTLVALWCIQTNPVDRPAMTRVVEMLEGTHESLSIPPKPYLCSPPRSPQSLVISSSVT